MATIVNQKDILVKGKTHQIEQMGSVFKVTSGSSGKTYWVTLNQMYRDGAVKYQGGRCDCPWGTKGGTSMRAMSGCSHVQAVMAHIAEQDGRAVSAWGTSEDARRQHRPIQVVGDGVILTSRKV